jgi:hypothetical protein
VAAAHEQADKLTGTMMGAGAGQQIHVFMGRRFTDCGGSRISGGFVGMMGGGDETGAM